MLEVAFGYNVKAYQEAVRGLEEAVRRKSYPGIYKELRLLTETIRPGPAFCLLYEALDVNLSLRAVEAILERSAPLPEILEGSVTVESIRCLPCPGKSGLVEKAACLDRADVLSLLLERGAGPNRTDGFDVSPLEAALYGRALKAVKLLISRPELDTAWTPHLLKIWARPVTLDDTRPEACLRAIAPRFTGWEARSGLPLPIPEPMTAQILAKAENWPLLERFCLERAPVSPEDGLSCLQTVFRAAPWSNPWTEAACAPALSALFGSCPGLLSSDEACRELLRFFLSFGGDGREILRPWVESLGPRPIAMSRTDWEDLGFEELPELWRRLLPNGPALVLDRWSDVLYIKEIYLTQILVISQRSIPAQLSPEALRRILDACPVRGEGRAGGLSPLAKAVLLRGDAPLIESLFRQPGGLLAAEDPDALTNFVLRDGGVPRANRAAALACVRREAEGYDL